ncbi:MAG: hypothetical protein AAF215_17455 [Cyanobacteria bacterium P01_A01_bin.123]
MSTAPLTPPMPAVEPLELLYVTNGSLLTADRWWQAHHYYQHRQNLHYQSLHQPGIVHGLGVRCIPAPETMPSELRDQRWIEIQPGIAIDLVGNPIVVDQPVTFRITSTVIERPITVYVVLAYVDPQSKQWSGIPAAVVREEFRINERTTPPGPEEVELCQIRLTSNGEPLQDAANVLSPVPQELDLRHRQRVRARSQQPVQVGLISEQQDSPLRDRLTALLKAVGGLYPPLAGPTTVQAMSLVRDETAAQAREEAANADVDLPEVTLLVLPYAEAIALSEAEIERLQTYVAHGSTLLIEYAEANDHLSRIQELYTVQAELQTAIDDLQGVQTGTELSRMRQSLLAEQRACESALAEQLAAIRRPIQQWGQGVSAWAETLSQPPIDSVDADLTQSPFLFDELPHLPTGPVHLMSWGSVVLVVGSLSAAWTRQQFDQPLPRSTLRSAQELGINILYQASLRQQMIQAQHP